MNLSELTGADACVILAIYIVAKHLMERFIPYLNSKVTTKPVKASYSRPGKREQCRSSLVSKSQEERLSKPFDMESDK